jgi:hypothetical protein
MLSLLDRPGYSRREFLRIGGPGLGGLSLPHLLAASTLADSSAECRSCCRSIADGVR